MLDIDDVERLTSPEALAKLSPEERRDLLEALEALHRERNKTELAHFARHVEVPGTPSPLSRDDRIRLLQRKAAVRKGQSGKWSDDDAIVEDVDLEPDIPESEWYPKHLEPAAHHDLIMHAIQALMEEEPVTGPLTNGHGGIVPEGIMLFMPPGSAKSSYASVVAPAWIAGRWPGTDIIATSYAADLAKRFGRRVRSICRSQRYQDIMGCTLTGDNQAVDQWSLTNGSTYKSVGILGGITGSRADVLFIDDPIAGREEAESEVIRDKTNAAIKDDAFTRLKPFGKIVMILCLTGDTPILMADGTERPLREVRAGDRVATYDGNKLTSSVVRHLASQGEDRIFQVRMKSGRSVRANARHPFLTINEGILSWQTTASLGRGSRIVAARSALQRGADEATLRPGATAACTTAGFTNPAPLRMATGASSITGQRVRLVAAIAQQCARACVTHITRSTVGQKVTGHLRSMLRLFANDACDTATALIKLAMTGFSKNSVASAQSVDSRPPAATPVLIGVGSYASTTVMTLEKLGVYSATTATSLSDTAKRLIFSTPQLDTYEIDEDEVISVDDAGRDDVFDLQVEGTENFIANGLVSHNTRWHQDDPAGHILGEDWEGQSGLHKGTDGRWWLVLSCPLICDMPDDPLGRKIGERLWPEWFTERHVELARAAGERTWNSLQQQKPSASEGVILLRKYWRCWPHGKPEPTDEQKEFPHKTEPPDDWIQCWLVYDTAFEEGQDADYSAMTAWCSFARKVKHKDKGEIKQQNIMLIGAWRGKVQAVDLFRILMDHVKHFRPDHIVIEKKASGIQLLQQLRRQRPQYIEGGQVFDVLVHEWVPPFPPAASGKVPRAHSAALELSQGSVWYLPGRQTEMVRKEAAAFPNATNDDWVDTVTSSILWSRSINLLENPRDILTKAEDEQTERDDADWQSQRGHGYGNSGSPRKSKAVRSLYGRSTSKGVHSADDDDD